MKYFSHLALEDEQGFTPVWLHRVNGTYFLDDASHLSPAVLPPSPGLLDCTLWFFKGRIPFDFTLTFSFIVLRSEYKDWLP